jgi:flagellin
MEGPSTQLREETIMGLRINQNIQAMNAYRNLSVTDGQMSKSLEKLSSGYRINRAADDAAGLSISEGLRSQVGGLKVAVRNAQDGVNVAQTADGALNETTSILQRMRDLAVQASNGGSQDLDAQKASQQEFTQLSAELSRIAGATKFGNQSLLDGNYAGNFQVGSDATSNSRIQVDLSAGNTSLFGGSGVTGFDAAGLGVSGLNLSTGSTTPTWTSGPGTVDFAATTAPSNPTLTFGGNTYTADLTGWDNGGTSDAAAKNQALTQKAFDSALKGSSLSASVDNYGAVTVSGPVGAVSGDLTSTGLGTATFASTSTSGAVAAITKIDAAIKGVSAARSYIGASQNRFEHTINNINVAVENLSASESAIRDTDMASEMVSFTRSQILSQAGTSMLAQANQASQSVLKLLG